ncbi:hypothetical protein [Glutamicibacter nicotianae]
MTRKNLGGMFEPGASEDPTASLKGFLTPKPSKAKATPPADPAAQEEALGEVGVETSTANDTSRKRNVKQPHSSVYLPANVYKALRKESLAASQSYTELLFRALSRVPKEKLGTCFGGVTASGLPEGMPGAAPLRKRRGGGEGGTQIQLRLTSDQVAWIDDVYCTEVGAPTRSALISTLFALDLKVDVPQYS